MQVGAFELTEPVPELHDTRAFAMLKPWVDVGRVGTLVLNRLERHLGARELGRLARPGTFFDFTRYRPYLGYVGGKRVLTIPNTVVNYATGPDGKGYLFLHIHEPHALGEEYCESIVALLKHFDVAEYCRVGGFYDSVPHTRPLVVTATLNEAQARLAKGLVSPRRNTYQGPTSIVNLVGDLLAQSETAVSSAMVHLPQYVRLEEDEMGAARAMQVLCAVFGFPPQLADSTSGQRQYMEISRAVDVSPDVKTLITQLEAYYDKTQAAGPEEKPPTLSPDVERFLKDVSKGLESQDSD